MAAISTAVAVAGVGFSAYGSYKQYKSSKDMAKANAAIAAEEAEQEAIRRRAAELDAKRRQLELVRNQQRARSLALSNATSQGASQGSGLQGGYGQIAGDTGVNLLGITQNQGLSNQIFDSNMQISQQRQLLAKYQGDAAFGQGLSSLGGALLNNMGTINSLSKGFGFGANSGGGGNLYGGYGGQVSAMGRGGIY